MNSLIFFLLSWFCLFSWDLLANPMTHLKRGDQAAQEFLNQLESKKQEAGPHPFSNGPSKESSFTADELEGRAQFLTHNDPESASQMIVQSSKSRPHVKIDPQKDPLMSSK